MIVNNTFKEELHLRCFLEILQNFQTSYISCGNCLIKTQRQMHVSSQKHCRKTPLEDCVQKVFPNMMQRTFMSEKLRDKRMMSLVCAFYLLISQIIFTHGMQTCYLKLHVSF